MSRNAAESTFEFINVSDIHEPQDATTKTTIRRQAMSKAAAARRQKGNYGKINLGQPPVIVKEPRSIASRPAPFGCSRREVLSTAEAVIPTIDAEGRSENDRSGIHLTSNWIVNRTIPASLPSVGYESMRIRYDFDVLDLSALTCFHSSRATAQVLSLEPSRLVSLLRCRQWSYLSFLPSRFGHTTCLDDAIRCVAAKVRFRLVSPGGPLSTMVVALYSKALASLQAVLSNPDQWMQPEVLCATQMLAIYEAGKLLTLGTMP